MIIDWWNDVVSWFTSTQGRLVFTSVALPFLAILVAGILAAMIARGSSNRLIAQQDREAKATAIATYVANARRAAAWSTLTSAEKEHVDHQLSAAEVHIRLLPLTGSTLAADWAAHKISEMKRNSAAYSFQADHDLTDLRDGLVEWQARPNRAKKMFAADVASWTYDQKDDEVLAARQREWAAAQFEASTPAPTADATAYGRPDDVATSVLQPASTGDKN